MGSKVECQIAFFPLGYKYVIALFQNYDALIIIDTYRWGFFIILDSYQTIAKFWSSRNLVYLVRGKYAGEFGTTKIFRYCTTLRLITRLSAIQRMHCVCWKKQSTHL